MTSASPSPDSTRPRALYILLVGATVAAGLASRRYASALPAAVGLYAGDVLWAAMVYLILATVWVRAPGYRIATAAIAFSVGIELSQLYHAPWIDAIRATPPGGLVLGFGFLWSDIVCYAVGVALTAAVDGAILRHLAERSLRLMPPDHIVS